jgi:hypothetical protein
MSVASGQSPYEHRNRGIGIGALMGALTGGAIGDGNGEAAAGAAIGAVVGGLTGAAIGDSVDRDIAYNRAVTQQQLNARLSRAVSPQVAIEMTQSRLADSVIITHIQSNGVPYRPQTADLIAMSNAGVSEGVIRAMQTAPLATAPTPVYRENVIVERVDVVAPRVHYVAPRYVYPVPHPHYHHPRYQHCQPGVHWGFSFSN